MIQTFVLVLVYANSIAVVPGYGSRAECEAAARFATVHVGVRGANCIPGPVEAR
jgi:hypothetical protein